MVVHICDSSIEEAEAGGSGEVSEVLSQKVKKELGLELCAKALGSIPGLGEEQWEDWLVYNLV